VRSLVYYNPNKDFYFLKLDKNGDTVTTKAVPGQTGHKVRVPAGFIVTEPSGKVVEAGGLININKSSWEDAYAYISSNGSEKGWSVSSGTGSAAPVKSGNVAVRKMPNMSPNVYGPGSRVPAASGSSSSNWSVMPASMPSGFSSPVSIGDSMDSVSLSVEAETKRLIDAKDKTSASAEDIYGSALLLRASYENLAGKKVGNDKNSAKYKQLMAAVDLGIYRALNTANQVRSIMTGTHPLSDAENIFIEMSSSPTAGSGSKFGMPSAGEISASTGIRTSGTNISQAVRNIVQAEGTNVFGIKADHLEEQVRKLGTYKEGTPEHAQLSLIRNLTMDHHVGVLLNSLEEHLPSSTKITHQQIIDAFNQAGGRTIQGNYLRLSDDGKSILVDNSVAVSPNNTQAKLKGFAKTLNGFVGGSGEDAPEHIYRTAERFVSALAFIGNQIPKTESSGDSSETSRNMVYNGLAHIGHHGDALHLLFRYGTNLGITSSSSGLSFDKSVANSILEHMGNNDNSARQEYGKLKVDTQRAYFLMKYLDATSNTEVELPFNQQAIARVRSHDEELYDHITDGSVKPGYLSRNIAPNLNLNNSDVSNAMTVLMDIYGSKVTGYTPRHNNFDDYKNEKIHQFLATLPSVDRNSATYQTLFNYLNESIVPNTDTDGKKRSLDPNKIVTQNANGSYSYTQEGFNQFNKFANKTIENVFNVILASKIGSDISYEGFNDTKASARAGYQGILSIKSNDGSVVDMVIPHQAKGYGDTILFYRKSNSHAPTEGLSMEYKTSINEKSRYNAHIGDMSSYSGLLRGYLARHSPGGSYLDPYKRDKFILAAPRMFKIKNRHMQPDAITSLSTTINTGVYGYSNYGYKRLVVSGKCLVGKTDAGMGDEGEDTGGTR